MNTFIKNLDRYISRPSDPFEKNKFDINNENDAKMLEDVRRSIIKLGERCFDKCVSVQNLAFKYDEKICVKNCIQSNTNSIKYMIYNEQKLDSS